MTLTQFKTLTFSLFIAALVAQPLQARANTETEPSQDLSKEQAIGISSGAVIGAIFGGPPGAFIVAIVGDLIAKNMMMDDELETAKLALNTTTLSYQDKLARLEQEHRQELVAAQLQHRQVMVEQAENFLMSLMFAKGSSEVAEQYHPQIVAMASLLKQNPEIAINLSGYTDALGTKDNNLTLAKNRVSAVKQLLVEQGVSEIQIHSEAIGEVALKEEEKVVPNSFDRRVVMQLTSTNTEVAKN
ncbi:sortase-associated OmpA-like protein PdsO [Thalassotalea sp. PS06]|uniref:sortase-associated OmpA-like protein PdsO n=1 Tax=Thalassotalea sp. PS06 TaxID=2594005 RepID=UPI001164FC7F|nr:sortase-associated OmpA-like protein PdsO [Thalassotalea sp. PS06]QDP00452.1 sortase-associated OmpA-like protein PdsO [Thalassotalea sp. PS06]